MTFDKGSFGGINVVMVGFFSSITGIVGVGKDNNFDWMLDAGIHPITFGSIGYRGSQKTVKTSLGWHVGGEAFQRKEDGSSEMGVAIEALGQSLQDSYNRSIQKSSLAILFQTRIRFL